MYLSFFAFAVFSNSVDGCRGSTGHRRGKVPTIIDQWFVGDFSRGERQGCQSTYFAAAVIVSHRDEPTLLAAEPVLNGEAFAAPITMGAKAKGAEPVS